MDRSTLVLPPTTLAGWHALVAEAEYKETLQLSEDLESYLVFLLIRFTENAAFSERVLALDFLNGLNASGQHRQALLRDVGDACLLYAGFFPKRAINWRVSFRYVVDLGQTAYSTLSDAEYDQFSSVYAKLKVHFISLMDVLLAIREYTAPHLLPQEARAIWQATGSQVAYEVLHQYDR